MKVKVDTQDLKIGMYVCELDRPWRETPFLFQGFEIRTEEELGVLREYCRAVFVLSSEHDSELSRPRSATPHSVGPLPQIEARENAAGLLDQAMLKINNRPDARPVYSEQTTLEEEIDLVKDIFVGASDMIREVMWQAKFGKSLDLPGARDFVAKMMESILRNPDALTCFAQIKKKDEYTAMHGLRVAILAMIFGRQLAMAPEAIEQLGLGALLFDVGKMKIPSEILNKPGSLAADEMLLVKGHVAWSAEILGRTPQMPPAVIEIAQRHHERYDGSGYGEKLKGESIGQYGMIAGLVDFYDAITSDRAYRSGISPYSALQKLYEWRGTMFQPALVEKFIQCLGIYPIGSVVELNTGEIAVVAALNRLQRLKPRVVLVLQKDRSPYPNTPLTNLATRKTADGHPCEIERVLDPASVNIDPSRYLPLPGVA
jgi:HD-GYP domain-containing protein (c-di-GMP phosphodiesterase class II)